jgi:hypothetical protein
MRAGTDYRFKLKLRGLEITFRPLSVIETVTVEADAREQLSKMKSHQQTDLIHSLLFAQKTIQQASTSEPGKMDFQISEAILEKCTPDEVMYLFNEYAKVVERVNPSVEKMSVEELKALVESTKKNPSTTIVLSFWQLQNLCHALIEEIALLVKSSGGQSTALSMEQ